VNEVSLAHWGLSRQKQTKGLLLAKQCFCRITLLNANIIIIRTIFPLQRNVFTSFGHVLVTVKRNEVPVGCYCTYMIYVGGVMCVLDWFAYSLDVFVGLCFVFTFV
jgi:hypothetical protein